MKKVLMFLCAICIMVTSGPLVLTAALPNPSTAIKIKVDNETIPNITTVIVNDRTMVKIRDVVEAIGGDVSWNGNTQTVTLKRATTAINLTIGKNTMLVNGKSVAIDAAPVIVGGSTYIPVRTVMEQFSQSVKWDEATKTIYITENWDKIKNENLDLWIIGMKAIYTYIDGSGNSNKNVYSKTSINHRDKAQVDASRRMLSSGWSCDSREDLIDTIQRMTEAGHNDNFMYDAALINSLTESQYNQLIAQSTGMDKYMWKYVKDLSKKWGDKGIVAWDMYRMTNIATHGYVAGYLEYEEVYELIRPVAKKLQSTFSSWDEANENFLDGYAYWGRIDVTLPNTEYTTRKQLFNELKTKYKNDVLFNESLWGTPVK